MQERLPAGSGYVRPPVASDTVDVADVVRTLSRQWRAVLAFTAMGVIAALAIVLFAPRRFDGKVTVYAHPGTESGTSIGGRVTGIGDLLGSLGSLGIGGSLETELQMLRSRALAGAVVDSLQLQFIVKGPAGVAPGSIVPASNLPGSFAPRTYEFQRGPGGAYRVSGDTAQLTPGVPGRIAAGTITLQPRGLPDRFTLKVLDREDAITRFGKRLSATKAGGEIAKVVYRGDDSTSAAAAANALVKFYLDQRKTTDRGVNQKRVEYVSAQLDQTAQELSAAERALRREQESSQIFDAGIVGKVEWESSAELRKTLTDLQVEEGSIKQLLVQLDSGHVKSRDLAAFPTFMKGSSVSPLAQQLSDLEGQRIRLLERRTERDPDVRALDNTMLQLQATIASMARSYANGVSRQRQQMQARVDSVDRQMLALPAAAERGGRLERDIKRLTTIYTALQAQLVEARLAAIGEGGDIRQIDVAVPQRKPAFPLPWLTMGVGTAGGLLTGLIAALFLGWFGRWLRDPVEVERAVGISAQRFEPDAPLLVNAQSARSVLVVPLAPLLDTGTVAQRMARTARQRFVNATVLDLSNGHVAGNGTTAVDTDRVGALIEDLEQRHGMVVVQTPGLLNDTTMAALREDRTVVLVAPPGPVDRGQLAHAVDLLRRLQVPCAGVVMSSLTRPPRVLSV